LIRFSLSQAIHTLTPRLPEPHRQKASTFAMSSLGPFCREPLAPQKILTLSHNLHVGDVDAGAVPAKMIYNQTSRNLSECLFPDVAMEPHVLAIDE
jgi:hypothetical protein